MKIKILWGFVGDAAKLKTTNPHVRAGEVFDDVDPEYAHLLIGKGLAAEHDGKDGGAEGGKKATKQVTPTENK